MHESRVRAARRRRAIDPRSRPPAGVVQLK
jgi:hypothetical protein